MTSSSERTFEHDLSFSFSPKKISNKANKKSKEATMSMIMSFICALFNSGGGRLTLKFDVKASRKELDKCLKMIEQRVRNLTSATAVSEMVITTTLSEIVMFISPSSRLVTLDYHLYLPHECEVVLLPPAEPVENIRRTLQGRINQTNPTKIGTHCTDFFLAQDVGFSESKSCQYKMIKAEPSKYATVAKRICGKSNKISSYISAFANYSGGHIYYGIDDEEGIVFGEKISEEDKNDIASEVAKSVKKMVWPSCINGPKKGVHWDIFFEPVKKPEGDVIESLYVIVVFVAQCRGGVFAEEPLSYKVVDGKVVEMRFQEWSSHFQETSSSLSRSSGTDESDDITEAIKQERNNRNAYKKISNLQMEPLSPKQSLDVADKEVARYPEGEPRLMAYSGLIMVAYKRHNFEKAESLLKKYQNHLSEVFAENSQQFSQFEIKGRYLRSCIESAKCSYKRSFQIAKEGLDKMESESALVPSKDRVDFYMHAAMLACILFCRSQDVSFRNQAHRYLHLATEKVESLECSFDLSEKLHIYKACVLLGCTLTGEAADSHITSEDIKAARYELLAVQKLRLEGHTLSHFRRLQYMSVECDYFLRFEPNNKRTLKYAFELATETLALAEKYHFNEMALYSRKRQASITEKLVRSALGSEN